MNIYAIRDRLLDYYMQPFAGPEDKAVLAAIARTINSTENMSDVAQAPHHFEVWKLGHVTVDGHIVPERELIADCAGLIRPDIRKSGKPQGNPAESDAGGSHSPTGTTSGRTGTNGAPVPRAAQEPSDEAGDVLYATPPGAHLRDG